MEDSQKPERDEKRDSSNSEEPIPEPEPVVEDDEPEEIKIEPGRIDIVGWVSAGWQVYSKFWGSLSLASFIFIFVLLLAQFIPYVGNLIFMGPMMLGLYMVTADIISGKEFKIGRLFQGFAFFLPVFLANLLITVFTTIGFVLLVIPGLVIGGWYLFSFIFILDRNLDHWSAMEESRKLAWDDMVGMTIFYVCLGAINLIGVLFFFVGLLATIPITTIATLVAFDKLAGFKSLLKEKSISSQNEPEPTNAAPGKGQSFNPATDMEGVITVQEQPPETEETEAETIKMSNDDWKDMADLKPEAEPNAENEDETDSKRNS